MARAVRDAKMETRAARARLPVQNKPHWRCLVPGALHLGYTRRRADQPGAWSARRYLGKDARGVGRYSEERLGLADDYQDADGTLYLSFADAQRAAHERVAAARAEVAAVADEASRPPTVAEAVADYVAHLRLERPGALREVEGRARTHILPAFGERRVDALTTDALVRWRDAMAAAPARLRTRPGEQQRHKTAAVGDALRSRRATVNRTVTVLKAVLNHAFRLGRVADDTAWRRVKPFGRVDAARPGHLSEEEAARLLNAANAASGFRDLVHAALMTGCRYGELCALEVRDFARGRITIRMSKSGKARQVRLSDEGAEFFRSLTAGRPADERMLLRGDGAPWGPSHQSRPMLVACRAARVEPIGFHQLRHTWASLSVMNSMPLMVVAENLGHADTRMVEKHYGHLTEDYMDEAVRAAAPRFGVARQSSVVPLRRAP
ncbi:tyrosine-type recombinase/integrase [Antarcticirhabdus aurantiaca]|uniref:Site-specific integrase n=1 Tax=Antarcticirhabdus aurantiaca TaxID=2606717 RepID=A0ACD4NJT5_9HYPH|nr:site-specific integrase [Antarcticirhabdus aurantiaca]WAJ27041.1 site-specific integrase [Jeongeuplla avenae]